MVRGFATEARLAKPDAFAQGWHMLMKGSIVRPARATGELRARRNAPHYCCWKAGRAGPGPPEPSLRAC
jgi:hypothetical protein